MHAPMLRVMAWSAVLLAGCIAPPPPPTTGTVSASTFATKALGTYQLIVRVPPEYAAEPERRFPVVVQLDATFSGLGQHAVTAGLLSELEAQRKAAPAIVVGLAYPEPDAPPNGRFRDYTFPNPRFAPTDASRAQYGFGAEAFYAALRDEILPHVDATWRTDGKARTLVGHSLGGAFVLFSLFHYDAQTNAHFDKFVAASPSYPLEEGALFGEEAKARSRLHFIPARLFVGMGKLEGPAMNVYQEQMVRRLDGYSALALDSAQFEGADHLANMPASYARGLAWVNAR